MLQQTLKAAEAVANKMAQPARGAVAAPLRKRVPPEAETPEVEETDGQGFKRLKTSEAVEKAQHDSSSTSPDEGKATCSPTMAMEVEVKTQNSGDKDGPPKVDGKEDSPKVNDKGPNTPEDSEKPEENGTPETDHRAEEAQEPANQSPGQKVWKGARKVLSRQAGQNPVQVCVLFLFQFVRAHI